MTPGVNSRIKQDKIDFDYLHKLNQEELAWLDKFMNEENNAAFLNDGTDFNQTKEERKKIYDRNNSANRDQYGIVKAKVANTHLLQYEKNISKIEEQNSHGVNPQTMENAYIEFIESKELDAMIKEYQDAMSVFREPLLEQLPEQEQFLQSQQDLPKS